MYFEALAALEAGGDPKGVIRDTAANRLLVIPGYERWVSGAERRQMAEGAEARPLSPAATGSRRRSG